MPPLHPPSSEEPAVVIVTTAAELAELVDSAVDRAVRRAVADVLAAREEPTKWLPTRRAEDAYGKSRGTLDRWAKEGRIEKQKIGGSIYYASPD